MSSDSNTGKCFWIVCIVSKVSKSNKRIITACFELKGHLNIKHFITVIVIASDIILTELIAVMLKQSGNNKKTSDDKTV